MKKGKKIRPGVITAAIVMGIIVFIFTFADPGRAYYSGFHETVSGSFLAKALQSVDFWLNDFMYQPDDDPVLPITVIGIDEKSLTELGRYEYWTRDMYAALLDRMHYEGDPDDPSDDMRPAVVCFDILFTGNVDPESDALYADTCARYGDTIQGIYFDLYDTHDDRGVQVTNVAKPYDALYAASTAACTNNALSDGYARTVFVDYYNDEPVDSLGLAAYKAYLEYNGREYVPHRYFTEGRDNIYFTYSCGNRKYGKPFDYMSFSDVILGDAEETAGRVKDRIVFVGAYAAGFSDDFFTPASSTKMYGVDIHANTCEAIAQGKLQVSADRTVVAVVYTIVSILLVIFSGFVPLAAAISGPAAAIVIDLAVNCILRGKGIYLPVAYLILPLLIIMLAAIFMHYVNARVDKAKINNAFRMYVAPEVVNEMAGDGGYELKLGGQTKDIAVLFIDIRGFTTMSEGLEPEQVVSILNEYFSLVTDAIFKNRGTLDKFIGDAAMAVFNSPNDLDDYVYRAVHTAWDVALGSQELAARLLEKHGRTINYGIGVNCGPATIGNIGSEFRMDFTAIGDTVNTSARLESNAKAGQILISQAVYDRTKDWIEAEEIGNIPLKGKTNEVFVYNVTKVIDKPGYNEEASMNGKHKRKKKG